MRSLRPGACPKERRGTSSIELAVTLPVLLLVVFGCVDFGRAMHFSMALENAAGAGCDYAATHRFTDYNVAIWKAGVLERVFDEMQGVSEFDAESLNVSVESEDGPNGRVRVTVTATYLFETVVDWPDLPNSVNLRHRVSAWQYR